MNFNLPKCHMSHWGSFKGQEDLEINTLFQSSISRSSRKGPLLEDGLGLDLVCRAIWDISAKS